MQSSDNCFLTGLNGNLLFQKLLNERFQNNLVIIDEKINTSHHGWFMLEYKHIKSNYHISIEGELNCFSIRITDDCGDFVWLNQLAVYDNEMTKPNIVNAVEQLQKILDGPIEFYRAQNGKLYKKTADGLKKIKDWQKLR